MVRIIQPAFTGGEISPQLYGRFDLAKYAVSVKTCRNWVVRPHGGVDTRPGFGFCGKLDGNGRLLRFQFNALQAYVLALSENTMMIIKDKGLVLGPLVLAGTYKWTASGSGTNEYYLEATAGGVPDQWGNGSDLREPQSGEVHLDGSASDSASLGSLAAGNWGWGDNDTLGYDTVYVRLSDGTDPDTKADAYVETVARITTPFAAADLNEIRFAQSADTMYLAHPSYAPRALTRTAHYAWGFAAVSFAAVGAAPTAPTLAKGGFAGAVRTIYYKRSKVNADGSESELSTAGTIAVDWSWPSGAYVTVTGSGTAGDTYRIYKSLDGGYTYGQIAEITMTGASFTTNDVNITPDMTLTPVERYEPFSGLGYYPGAVAIYQQRVWWGRTDNAPQTLWATRLADFTNLGSATPLRDDDGIEAPISDSEVNEIMHLVSTKNLMVFTTGGAFVIDGSNGITPTTVNPISQGVEGCGTLEPVIAGNAVLFAERYDAIIREFSYSLQDDGYIGRDLTILADHLFRDYTLVDWTFQRHPDPVLWCVRSDGAILGLTYVRDQDVWAWHQHHLGGSGVVKSIASIPGATQDEVYALVEREINGVTVYFGEYMSERMPEGSMVLHAGLDSHVSYNGLNATATNLMTLTGGSTWGQDETGLTLTASGAGHAPFAVGDVGRFYQLRDGVALAWVEITGFTNTSVVTVTSRSDIPASLRALATSVFARLLQQVAGLDHWEGASLHVFADATKLGPFTVTSGAIDLGSQFAVVHVGYGYDCDLETLTLNYQTAEGPSLGQFVSFPKVMLQCQETRNIEAGRDLDHLSPQNIRTTENWDAADRSYSDFHPLQIAYPKTREGRVALRASNGEPASIVSITPSFGAGDA